MALSPDCCTKILDSRPPVSLKSYWKLRSLRRPFSTCNPPFMPGTHALKILFVKLSVQALMSGLCFSGSGICFSGSGICFSCAFSSSSSGFSSTISSFGKRMSPSRKSSLYFIAFLYSFLISFIDSNDQL